MAAAWARDASPCYMLFGELGAMSAAFMTWIPLKTPSARRVPLSIVATSALALVAIAHLAPADPDLGPDLWSGLPPPARAGPPNPNPNPSPNPRPNPDPNPNPSSSSLPLQPYPQPSPSP